VQDILFKIKIRRKINPESFRGKNKWKFKIKTKNKFISCNTKFRKAS